MKFVSFRCRSLVLLCTTRSESRGLVPILEVTVGDQSGPIAVQVGTAQSVPVLVRKQADLTGIDEDKVVHQELFGNGQDLLIERSPIVKSQTGEISISPRNKNGLLWRPAPLTGRIRHSVGIARRPFPNSFSVSRGQEPKNRRMSSLRPKANMSDGWKGTGRAVGWSEYYAGIQTPER